MLVAPIVLVTIASGITSLADPKRARRSRRADHRPVRPHHRYRRLGRHAGCSPVRHGVGAPLGTAAPHALGTPVTPYDQLIGIIPLNIVGALAKGDMLALLFVAILVGVRHGGRGRARASPSRRCCSRRRQSCLKVVGIVMEATPFGVFALIANAVAANGAAVFVHVGWLALAVVLGSLIQIVVVHSLLLRPCSRGRTAAALLPRHRRCAGRRASRPASSSATLPVAMRVAEPKSRGRSPRSSSTVLPLGREHRQGRHGDVCRPAQHVRAAGVQRAAPGLWRGAADRRACRVRRRAGAVRRRCSAVLAAVLSAVGIAPEAQTAFGRRLRAAVQASCSYMTRTVPSASANLYRRDRVARCWEGELGRRRSTRAPDLQLGG